MVKMTTRRAIWSSCRSRNSLAVATAARRDARLEPLSQRDTDLAAVGVSAPAPEELRPKPKAPRPVTMPPARGNPRAASPGVRSALEGHVDPQSCLTRVADAPNRRMRAVLIPTNGKGGDPLHVWTHTLTHARVVLHVEDVSVLGLGPEADGLSDLLVPILEHLGEECRLRVAKGATHIWSGPVRLEAVERIPGDPNGLILDMAFGRTLCGPELTALKEV